MMDSVTVTLHIEPEKAYALAQLVKRIGWSEIRSNAVDDVEASDMRDAVVALQRSLSDAGISPR